MRTTFLQNNYIYVMPDGSRVESEEPRDDLKMHEVSPTASTTTKVVSSESSNSDGANEDFELEWEDINHLNLKILEPPVVDEHLGL